MDNIYKGILEDLMNEIIEEWEQAENKYGHFNSTHEAFAVLQEEVNEFWEKISIQVASEFS